MLTFNNLTRILPFEQLLHIILKDPQSVISQLVTDSRRITNSSETLFFAIKGKNLDGHAFIGELYEKGVRNFVVETLQFQGIFNLNRFEEANFLEVSSSIRVMQALVAWHRQQFDVPVIGVTGSNGKTIVKEWLYSLLQDDLRIVKSPRSYNSQIGVPLSVWQLNEKHQLAIFEAGISQKEEMEHLQKVILPTIGIFTNLGTAHDEGFEDSEEKLNEKLKLFSQASTLIFHQDIFEKYKDVFEKLQTEKLIWGETPECDLQIITKKNTEKGIFFEFYCKKYRKNIEKVEEYDTLYTPEKFSLEFPFSDNASIENILHCVTFIIYWNYTNSEIKVSIQELQKRIFRLKNVSMRLELKQGIQNCYVIDDSYNNDLAGLKIALDFLLLQKQKINKTLILSDVLEATTDTHLDELYENISDLVAHYPIQRFIGIGKQLCHFKKLFKIEKTSFYENTSDFLKNFQAKDFQNEAVLVKGARIFEFEKIVERLQQKAHRTVLEINLDALAHNLNFYRGLLKPQTKTMVMVKAFAYGSGIAEIANFLQFHRVDYLAVAYTDEGVQLRENGITLPIMVMNPSPETFSLLLEHHLEPEMYSFKILNEWLAFLEQQFLGEQTAIHLKIDTGMHRLGFVEQDLPELKNILQKNAHFIRLNSIMSHLAGADEATHNNFSEKQITVFKQVAKQIEQHLGYETLKHICNSPAIVRFPEAHFDMVRLGIGLYGVEVNGIFSAQLKTIGRLKTVISQIKHIPQGETIGYGRQGIADKPTKIATIAIGYADGFSRAFSKGVGRVKVRGVLAPVIGNVCMDMTMIDVTDVAEVQEGDEVIIFDELPSINDLAKSINTISYEILTNVSERVKRVFYAE